MTDNRDSAAFTAGIYQNVPELDYHSGRFGPHGSVSSTEAKRLLDCPALYKWSKENPTPPKAAFDFGHTVHGMVLGTGLDIYVHDHDSLRTKAAKEDIAAARERGQVPMSRADYARRGRLPGGHESPRPPGTPPRQTDHIERTQQ